MNYTHLGRTGLKVSRLCLGTMNFGDVTDEKTSARILDEALEAGIYLFGQRRRTSQFSYYNMSAHNVYYVKSPIEGIYATYRIHSSVSLLFT
ncbi:hypothetical protein NUBL17185_38990 [Klebsiella pneumoniae]|nr:hypothetical protein NUBL17185_38990 [Klebsiella pneumoniae]GKP69681.1 hypothetical protein NUBL13783_15510 [Klebsiella pneumoniae]